MAPVVARVLPSAVFRLATVGVASHVATPEPRPEMPVETGNPVALVRVRLEGVPPAPPLVTNAPELPTLIPRAVNTPVPVVVVEGAKPAPPPITRAFAAKAPELAHVEALLK